MLACNYTFTDVTRHIRLGRIKTGSDRLCQITNGKFKFANAHLFKLTDIRFNVGNIPVYESMTSPHNCIYHNHKINMNLVVWEQSSTDLPWPMVHCKCLPNYDIIYQQMKLTQDILYLYKSSNFNVVTRKGICHTGCVHVHFRCRRLYEHVFTNHRRFVTSHLYVTSHLCHISGLYVPK